MPRPASDLIARIAWRYYVQKQNQAEIAANLNLSRQSVQRYLGQALEQGIVVTRIDHRHLSECLELGQELQSRYRLQLCEVAPATAEQSAEEVFQSLCAPLPWVADKQSVTASTTLKNFNATTTASLLWWASQRLKATPANLIWSPLLLKKRVPKDTTFPLHWSFLPLLKNNYWNS